MTEFNASFGLSPPNEETMEAYFAIGEQFKVIVAELRSKRAELKALGGKKSAIVFADPELYKPWVVKNEKQVCGQIFRGGGGLSALVAVVRHRLPVRASAYFCRTA
jgi:hypothetical protein